MMFKKTFFSLVVFIALSLSYSMDVFAAQQMQPLDKIVAVVNNDVITQSDLDAQVAIIKNQLQHDQAPMPSDQQLEQQVLNHIIDETLQLQEAKQNGIQVDTATVNAAINQIAQQNNLTLPEFQQALQSQGMSYDSFRKDVRNQLIVNRVEQEEVAPNIVISQQEVDNYIKSLSTRKTFEYHLESIFVALPQVPDPDQTQEAQDKVNDIMGQLKQGADFQQIAIAESNGPDALKGGDMGWVPAGQLPPEIAERIQNAKKGSIIGPLRTNNGFLILKVVASREQTNKQVITQTEARHILLRTTTIFTDADAKAELAKLRKAIESGKISFQDAAKQYSQDPGSAVNGGDLGWVSPGELVPPFEQAMNQLQPGQISEPIKTQYGWHLIQVLARRQQDVTQTAQENQVRNYIFQRKFQEELQTWLSQLRQTAYIKIYLPPAPTVTKSGTAMSNPNGDNTPAANAIPATDPNALVSAATLPAPAALLANAESSQ